MKTTVLRKLACFILMAGMALPLSAQTQPFPANKTYNNGLMPGNRSGQDAASNYATWKTNYLEACSNGRYRVKFDTRSQTVSEGIGYGMLLSAYAGDRTVFDGLWNYYKDNRNGNGVMNWKINGCSGVAGANGATDADVDAAMALIVANYQWGASGSINYQNDAKALITAIKAHEVESGSNVLKPGDQFGGSSNTNPSYFAPGYFRTFATFMNDASWNAVADKCYDVINKNLSVNNAAGGLVSDWCQASGAHSQGANYSYDAARTPWRIAVDYAWYGNANAKAYSKKSSDFVRVTLGGSQNVKDGYTQSGSVISSYHNSTFTGAFACAAMGGDNQSHLDNSYADLKGINDANSYFNQSLKTLYLFLLSGNFYLPGSSTVVTPPPVQSPYGGTAWAVPGRIEAEKYDNGGTLAYNDATPGNAGGQFRTDDVDIEASTDAGGGYNIAYTAAGEWMEYTITVANAGKYDFNFRLASTSAGKSLHAEINGANITGAVSVPNTGGWQTWQTVKVSNISLAAGTQVLRLVMDTDGFNLNYTDIASPSIVTPVNQPPLVSITGLANNAGFSAPASVNITANASDSDGSISKVDFYNGSTLLGSDASAPYSFNWTNVAAGSYTLTAKATDNAAAVTTSSTISIQVTTITPVNQPPLVSITGPSNNAGFSVPASVNITANASDSDGSISKVDFYNGSTLLTSDASAPYSFNWTNVAAGSYTLTAKATDNAGAVTTSATVTITVTSGQTTGGCITEAVPDAAQWVVRNDWTDQNNGSGVSTADGSLQIKHRQWGNSILWVMESGKSVSVVSGQTYTLTFDVKNDAVNPVSGIEVGFASAEQWNGAVLAQPAVAVSSGLPSSFTTKTVTITAAVTGNVYVAYKLKWNTQPNAVFTANLKNIGVCTQAAQPQAPAALSASTPAAPSTFVTGANPFVNQTTVNISYAAVVPLHLLITDTNGTNVWESYSFQTNQTIGLGASLPIGIYMVNAYYDGKVSSFRIVKN